VLKVQTLFTFQKHLFGLLPVWVIHTTIYRADRCTLRLLVKADTFCALIRHYIVKIIGNGVMLSIRIYLFSVFQLVSALNSGTIRDRPFDTSFVDGVIGAFWFASSAIDTFVCYDDGHIILFFLTTFFSRYGLLAAAKIRQEEVFCKGSLTLSLLTYIFYLNLYPDY
jgi:hypothetical protein